jgi:hypothetical protein
MFVVQNKNGRKIVVYAATAQDAIDHAVATWGHQGWVVKGRN